MRGQPNKEGFKAWWKDNESEDTVTGVELDEESWVSDSQAQILTSPPSSQNDEEERK